MKKFYYSMFAAATLLLSVTSCSQEEDFVQSSNDVTTFSISLNDATQSRAVGEGNLVDKLYYEVFMEGESVKDGSVDFTSGCNLDLPLLNGEKYNIVFWAQNKNCTIYGVDDNDGIKTISVNYANVSANQESYDAFYNALNNFTADGNTHRIELRRPFAQLNLGTGDWSKVIVPQNAAPVTAISVTVKGLADTFNPFTGVASATTQNNSVTFDYSALPEGTFKVNNKDYKYLSLNYLLVPGTKEPQGTGVYVAQTNADKAIVNLTFNLKRGDKVLQPISVPNAPLQRNWRTNIIGDVLTGTDFDIVVKPETDGENMDIRNIDGIDKLEAAMVANGDSENSVTYYVNGLSTIDNVAVNIPESFKANDVTFIFNNIKDAANLNIAGNQYAKNVYIKLPNLTETGKALTTTINLPLAHVELLQGNFGTLTATTSPNTIVIGASATVGTLTVEQGNVEIQTGGEVEKIINGSNNNLVVTLGENVVAPETEGEGIELKTEKENGALSANSNETISRAVAIKGATVKVKAGDYTFPASVAAGVTIDCEEGTRFIGKSNFNINGATVRGADFWNDQDRVNAGYGSVINAIFENCSFTGVLGIYEAWAGETCEFIDCHFCAPQYSCNFSGDSPNNPVTFTRCSFMGWSSFGIDITFNDCVFDSEPGGTYNIVRVYGNTEFNGCEFIYGKLSKNEDVVIDAIKSDKEVKFTNCKVTNISGEEDYIFNHLANGQAGKTFIVDGATYTYQGSDIVKNTAGEYLVHSASALKALAKKINEGTNYFEGETIKLGADIDLKNVEWTPIGTATKDHGFMGNFDGNGKTIKNLKITNITPDSDNYAYAGLFGVTEGTDANNENYIKNLTIENVDITTKGHIVAAAIAYPYYTTIEDITVKGNINIEGGDYTAGVLAYTRICVNASNLSIEGNAGSSIEGKRTVGGVISDIQMNHGLIANYSNFAASGLIIKGEKSVGGISGIISLQTLNGATVKNVIIECNDARTGIVAGSLGGKSTITDVSYENVTGAKSVVGATYDNAADVVVNGDVYVGA